jgi:hypothetical protein
VSCNLLLNYFDFGPDLPGFLFCVANRNVHCGWMKDWQALQGGTCCLPTLEHNWRQLVKAEGVSAVRCRMCQGRPMPASAPVHDLSPCFPCRRCAAVRVPTDVNSQHSQSKPLNPRRRSLKSTLQPTIFWEMVKFVDLGVLYFSLVLPV